jgi:hypothetical protein
MPTKAPNDYTDLPLFWFLILEQSLDNGDLEQAAQAKRELKRLGVDIVYRRQRRPRQQEASA